MSFVINELTLEKLDNKHLQELFLKIRSKINAAHRKKQGAYIIKNLQMDMCFIQREIELRRRSPKDEARIKKS